MGDDKRSTEVKKNDRKITLRPPKPGEWGWIMQQHGTFYTDVYNFNENVERYTGEVVCDLIKQKETSRSRAWIADVDGEPMGCILCSEADENTAKLRLLLVVPEGRGFGLGTRLVDECVQFAKDSGFKKISLWTHGVLTDARRIYDKAGFKLVETRKHTAFGPELDGHILERDLQ